MTVQIHGAIDNSKNAGPERFSWSMYIVPRKSQWTLFRCWLMTLSARSFMDTLHGRPLQKLQTTLKSTKQCKSIDFGGNSTSACLQFLGNIIQNVCVCVCVCVSVCVFSVRHKLTISIFIPSLHYSNHSTLNMNTFAPSHDTSKAGT